MLAPSLRHMLVLAAAFTATFGTLVEVIGRFAP